MQRTKRVNVKFQYYEVQGIKEDGSEGRYDFRDCINKMIGVPLESRKREICEVLGRLEKCSMIKQDKYYALNFMRMSTFSNTYIVNENKNAEHIDLDDEDYIGQNTVVLYDPEYSLMMIQCNRGSYGVAAIENYINSFYSGEKEIFLRPVFNNFDGIIKDNQKVMKIDVRFANTREKIVQGRFFEGILDSFNKFEAVTAQIVLSVGRKRKSELDRETVTAYIGELVRNRRTVSSARVTLNDDQKSRVYDLFENIEHDIITMVTSDKGEIGFEYMAEEMSNVFAVTGARIRRVLLNREE